MMSPEERAWLTSEVCKPKDKTWNLTTPEWDETVKSLGNPLPVEIATNLPTPPVKNNRQKKVSK